MGWFDVLIYISEELLLNKVVVTFAALAIILYSIAKEHLSVKARRVIRLMFLACAMVYAVVISFAVGAELFLGLPIKNVVFIDTVDGRSTVCVPGCVVNANCDSSVQVDVNLSGKIYTDNMIYFEFSPGDDIAFVSMKDNARVISVGGNKYEVTLRAKNENFSFMINTSARCRSVEADSVVNVRISNDSKEYLSASLSINYLKFKNISILASDGIKLDSNPESHVLATSQMTLRLLMEKPSLNDRFVLMNLPNDLLEAPGLKKFDDGSAWRIVIPANAQSVDVPLVAKCNKTNNDAEVKIFKGDNSYYDARVSVFSPYPSISISNSRGRMKPKMEDGFESYRIRSNSTVNIGFSGLARSGFSAVVTIDSYMVDGGGDWFDLKNNSCQCCVEYQSEDNYTNKIYKLQIQKGVQAIDMPLIYKGIPKASYMIPLLRVKTPCGEALVRVSPE